MVSCSVYREKSFFARAFPAPAYLAMPAMGVDISDYAIKYIALSKVKENITLEAHGKVDLPFEVIERGEIKDSETVAKLLSRIKEEHGYNFVHLALPEEHAYLFQTQVPKGSPEEVEQLLEFHLKDNVPIGVEEAVFDYSVLSESEHEYTLNVSVYPQSIAKQYTEVLEVAGLKVLSMEIEGQATARALVTEKQSSPTLIVDIGRNSANLSIAQNGEVTFTAILEMGGDNITRTIARELNISFQEAEKLKREKGFCDLPEAKMVFDCLFPLVNKFADAIQKHVMYWHMHMATKDSGVGEVGRVILVGGNANVKGLSAYLEAVLEIPVDVGDVWGTIFSYEEYVPPIHASSSLEYTTAIGAALRNILRT